MITIGVYAGSFDPITNGHFEIIENSLKFVDKLFVVQGINPNKTINFSFKNQEENIALKKILKQKGLEDKVDFISYNGLIAEFDKEYLKPNNIKYDNWLLIRGIRNSIDYGYEANLSQANQYINKDVLTVYLETKTFGFVSSSLVRELISHSNSEKEAIQKIKPLICEELIDIVLNKKFPK